MEYLSYTFYWLKTGIGKKGNTKFSLILSNSSAKVSETKYKFLKKESLF